MQICGNSSVLFSKPAMALIHHASGGVFHSIGIIAWTVMHKAYLQKFAEVEAEHVKTIIEH